jgi:hypothetical protein
VKILLIKRVISLVLSLIGVGSVWSAMVLNVSHIIAPFNPSHSGWSKTAYAQAAPEILAATPLHIVGAGPQEDNTHKDVRLYRFVRQVNGGKDMPNIPQQIGDCVSWGWRNAIVHLMAIQLCRDGGGERLSDVFPPYIYGISRHQVGGDQIKGDGSCGVWAAKGSKDYGVVAIDEPGVPKYSGTIARNWGQNGPPAEMIELGKQYRLKSYAQVKSATEARDAICAGYPVTIASDFGTKTLVNRYNRWVAKGDDRWMHQMCCIAYDGTQAEPLFLILNSWGPNAHKAPLGDEPAGSFWVTLKQMDFICRQGDSWAYSAFDGFPLQTLPVLREQAFVGSLPGQSMFYKSLGGWLMMVSSILILIAACCWIAAAIVTFRGTTRWIIIAMAIILSLGAYANAHGEEAKSEEPDFSRVSQRTIIQWESIASNRFHAENVTPAFTAIEKQAEVWVYAPDYCTVCKKMKLSVGNGDSSMRVKWITGNEQDFPEWIKIYGIQHGYPIILFPKERRVTSGAMNIVELKQLYLKEKSRYKTQLK